MLVSPVVFTALVAVTTSLGPGPTTTLVKFTAPGVNADPSCCSPPSPSPSAPACSPCSHQPHPQRCSCWIRSTQRAHVLYPNVRARYQVPARARQPRGVFTALVAVTTSLGPGRNHPLVKFTAPGVNADPYVLLAAVTVPVSASLFTV